MGGGYDTCEDSDGSDTCVPASARGRRIYFFDADTGALQRTFTTDRAVAADVTVVNDVTTGLALYAYAADVGGNVYRINIGSAAPAQWDMVKLASLGCATSSTCFPRRKFFYAPDVVEERGTFFVLLGSGDREKPLTSATLSSFPNAASVSNFFFSLKDAPTTASCATANNVRCLGNSLITFGTTLPTAGNTGSVVDQQSTNRGWALGMSSREQVVTSAITIYGGVYFSTTQPQVGSSTTCVPSLGTARVYNVSYLDASPKNGTANRFETLPAGGLPPSPVAGKVTLDNGTTVPFVIGGSGRSSLTGEAKPPVATGRSQPGKRVYTIIKK
jgi:type IV pilus assembly protein PilY1